MRVVVRWATVDAIGGDQPNFLSHLERGRLSAMKNSLDRDQFVAVRMLLRQVVGEATGCAASDVVLQQTCARCGGPHGRPTVSVAGTAGPAVSMAHAGGIVMVAVSPSPVGVDLEPTTGGRWLDPEALRAWVRTEAVLKATGHGLDVDPQLVGLSDANEAPRLISWSGPGRRPVVRMADVDLGDPHTTEPFVACVARMGRRPLRIDLAEVRLEGLAGG